MPLKDPSVGAITEVIEALQARKGHTYTKLIATAFSIINLGVYSQAAFEISRQTLEIACDIDPEKYNMLEMATDVDMLVSINLDKVRSSVDGPTAT